MRAIRILFIPPIPPNGGQWGKRCPPHPQQVAAQWLEVVFAFGGPISRCSAPSLPYRIVSRRLTSTITMRNIAINRPPPQRPIKPSVFPLDQRPLATGGVGDVLPPRINGRLPQGVGDRARVPHSPPMGGLWGTNRED
jgi:hypothetical protein